MNLPDQYPNLFTLLDGDHPVGVSARFDTRAEDDFARGFLDGAGFAVVHTAPYVHAWAFAGDGLVTPPAKFGPDTRVDYALFDLSAEDGTVVMAFLTNPTALDALTLIAGAGASSPNADLVHPDLDDLARQAGVLAGQEGVLTYLADRIETAAPESAAEMRAVAAAKTVDLAAVTDSIRDVVTKVARFRAQNDADKAVARAAAAADQAGRVLTDHRPTVTDPGTAPIAWPKTMPDELAADFVSAFATARGFIRIPTQDMSYDRNTLRWSFFHDHDGRARADISVISADRRSGGWQEVSLDGADAELAELVDQARWAPVSAETRALVLKAAAFIGAQQFASKASADLVAAGRHDADFHAQQGALAAAGRAAVTAAVGAVRTEVQAAIDALTADLTAATANVETALAALPEALTAPEPGTAALDLGYVHAAWQVAYPQVTGLLAPRSGSGAPGVKEPRTYVAVNAVGDLLGRSAVAGVTDIDPDLFALLDMFSALRDAAEKAHRARVSLACYQTDGLVDVTTLDAARAATDPVFDAVAEKVGAFTEQLTPVAVPEVTNRDVATAVSVLRRISPTGTDRGRG